MYLKVTKKNILVSLTFRNILYFKKNKYSNVKKNFIFFSYIDNLNHPISKIFCD
nr:MAG TPA: hypothetical protein [Caudoviricetes sp.]